MDSVESQAEVLRCSIPAHHPRILGEGGSHETSLQPESLPAGSKESLYLPLQESPSIFPESLYLHLPSGESMETCSKGALSET